MHTTLILQVKQLFLGYSNFKLVYFFQTRSNYLNLAGLICFKLDKLVSTEVNLFQPRSVWVR